MNILLTEISSLTLDIQEVAVSPQADSDSFSGVLRQQYPGASENPTQVTEFKEIIEGNSTPDGSLPVAPQIAEQALWREFLATDSIRVSSDSDTVMAPGAELLIESSALVSAPQAVLQDIDSIGYKLPADGQNLPGITSSDALAAQLLNVPVADSSVAGSDAGLLVDNIASQSGQRQNADSTSAIQQSNPLSEGLRPELVAASIVATRAVFDPGQKTEPARALGIIRSARGIEPKLSPASPVPGPMLTSGLTTAASESGVQQPIHAVISAADPEVPVAMPLPGGREALATPLQEGAPRLAEPRVEIAAGQGSTEDDAELARTILSRDNTLPAGTQFSQDPTVGLEARNNEVLTPSTLANAQLASSQVSTGGTSLHYGQPISVAAPAAALPSIALPPQLDSMSLARGMDPGELGSNLGDRINWMVNQKQNTATIRLDPPMLGKLDVQVRMTDDATTITINTQHAQTRDMIDAASVRLRDLLQDSGYQNVNVDVSHQQDQQPGHSALPGDSSSVQSQEEAALLQDADLELQQQNRFTSDGLLDTFA